jgi:hypothetical protein
MASSFADGRNNRNGVPAFYTRSHDQHCGNSIGVATAFTIESLDTERETLFSQIVVRVATAELGAIDEKKRFGVTG